MQALLRAALADTPTHPSEADAAPRGSDRGVLEESNGSRGVLEESHSSGGVSKVDAAGGAQGAATGAAGMSGCGAGMDVLWTGVDVSAVSGVLQRLDLLPMSRQVLVETGIGKSIKALSRHGHPAVSYYARQLVQRWKGLLRPSYPLPLPPGVAADAHAGHLLAAAGRERIVLKLHGALSLGQKETKEENHDRRAWQLAREIEVHIACASVLAVRASGGAGGGGRGGGGGKTGARAWYYQRVRQLLYNLRDHQNAGLRDRVMSGELSTKALVATQTQDLANKSVVAARAKAREVRNAELLVQLRQKASLEAPNTDEYTCPACGSDRCHLEIGMKGGWISSEKEEKRDVTCCDCGQAFDGLALN